MSRKQKVLLIEPAHPRISVIRQCEIVGLHRSAYYYRPAHVSQRDLDLMRRMDEIYTALPYYGSPKITAQLQRQGIGVNHKAVERLMRVMGIQAVVPKKNTSKPHPAHIHYPYLLNGLEINHPNHVRGTDITYVRAYGIWFYLVAILDWYSRYVVAWRLSLSMSAEFCIGALHDALMIAVPDIHNSDQGSRFTAEEYTGIPKTSNIQISMDGRGRCFDNIFTERLWRTVKYEEVYLHEYRSFEEAHDSLTRYFHTYNHRRLHQSLGYLTPAEVYFGGDSSKTTQYDRLYEAKKYQVDVRLVSHDKKILLPIPSIN